MRIIYFGTASFAVPALEALAPWVDLVVTQPDKPSGRGFKVHPTPVRATATELGLPVESPLKCRHPDFIASLAAREADLFVVAAYGQILPQALLDVPRWGCFNLHGSILPRWRGAAPVQRAVEAGDEEAGVTLMKMDAGMDTGAMVAIARTPLGSDTTAGELYDQLAVMAAGLALDWRERLASPGLKLEVQDDALATHAKKITKEEGMLAWDEDPILARRKQLAFTPTPGAFLPTDSGPLKVVRCSLGTGTGQPGEILSVRPELEVAVGTGSWILHEIQPQGRKKMAGSEFANGARLTKGEFLSAKTGQTNK